MPSSPHPSNPPHTIQTLRNQLQRWEAQYHQPSAEHTISSGCAALDQLLPTGGFVPGQLVEWLSSRAGGGAATLAWVVALRAVTTAANHNHSGSTIVVVDQGGDFYPPAAIALGGIAWGVKPEQIMIVRPQNLADTMWAIDQALRCSAVAAVWTALNKIEPRHFRRMQLSAEEGATLGLLVRPADVHGQPSWSDLQLLVQPQPATTDGDKTTKPAGSIKPATDRRTWQLRVLRCRGGTAGGSLTLQMEDTTGQLYALQQNSQHHETSALHLAAQLARPANRRRSARA
jgi:hypothetical protein